MQGIHPRMATKKALRETVAAGEWVALEATSITSMNTTVH